MLPYSVPKVSISEYLLSSDLASFELLCNLLKYFSLITFASCDQRFSHVHKSSVCFLLPFGYLLYQSSLAVAIKASILSSVSFSLPLHPAIFSQVFFISLSVSIDCPKSCPHWALSHRTKKPYQSVSFLTYFVNLASISLHGLGLLL